MQQYITYIHVHHNKYTRFTKITCYTYTIQGGP